MFLELRVNPFIKDSGSGEMMCTLRNALQSQDPNKHNDIIEKASYIKLNSEAIWVGQSSRQRKCYCLDSGKKPFLCTEPE